MDHVGHGASSAQGVSVTSTALMGCAQKCPNPCLPECGVARFLTLLNGPWATLIVRDLLKGPHHFTELRDALPGISPHTLTGGAPTVRRQSRSDLRTGQGTCRSWR
ncbi:winged helix-turn-helix transcriptional regulator [Streptomyces sp. Li-HN-5-11]|uniref:winged helix-turn-helix transcriptional regulator n=1 Tax=Streptomyces sp. Li-HN-5-11 TaxID=3075432 RepID=UPI0037D9E52D